MFPDIVPLSGAAMACLEAHGSTGRGADGHIVKPIARLCPIIGSSVSILVYPADPLATFPGKRGSGLLSA